MPRRRHGRRKRVNADASERPAPNDGDTALQDLQDAETEKNSERKSSAISTHGSVSRSSDPNFYYNINGDMIYVATAPADTNDAPHEDLALLANESSSYVE